MASARHKVNHTTRPDLVVAINQQLLQQSAQPEKKLKKGRPPVE